MGNFIGQMEEAIKVNGLMENKMVKDIIHKLMVQNDMDYGKKEKEFSG